MQTGHEWFTQPALSPGSRSVVAQINFDDDRGLFKWHFAQSNHQHLRLKCLTKPALISEGNVADCPGRPPSFPNALLAASSKQSDYLKRILPDVYLPHDLLYDVLAEEAGKNLLRPDIPTVCTPAIVPLYQASNGSRSAIAAFPSADQGCNVSLAIYSQTPKQPSIIQYELLQDVLTSRHPQRQIQLTHHTAGQAILLNRTVPSTCLSLIELTNVSRPSAKHIKLSTIKSFPFSKTGGKRQIDACLDPYTPLGVSMMNSLGAVYSANLQTGQIIQRMTKEAAEPYVKLTTAQETVGKVSYGSRYFLGLAAFDYDLLSLDSRLPADRPIKIYTIPEAKKRAVILDTLKQTQSANFKTEDYTTCLLTSEKLLWVDERMPLRAVFSWEHLRSDACLYFAELARHFAEERQIVLGSRLNRVKTIYTMSTDPVVSSLLSPYALEQTSSDGSAGVGSSIFLDCSLVIEADAKGSIYHSIYSQEDVRAPISFKPVAEQYLQLPPQEQSIKAEQDVAIPRRVNLRKVFLAMFERPKLQKAEANGNGIRQIQDMPFTLMKKDLSGRLLTSYELAILSNGDYKTFRAKWSTVFSAASLDVHQTSLSLILKGLADNNLFKEAPYQIPAPITTNQLIEFIPDCASTPDDVENVAKQLEGVYTPMTDVKEESQQGNREACQQLALDMFLSSQIYGGVPFKYTKDDTVNPIRNARGLQVLGTFRDVKDPPPVQFPFFKLEPEQSELQGPSKSTRVLLSEWEIGTDPFKITFAERYKETSLSAPQLRKEAEADALIPPFSQPLPARNRASHSRSMQPFRDGSHRGPSNDPARDQSQPQSQSLQPGPSTQILPGRHGGRPLVQPLRAKKKRVGGF